MHKIDFVALDCETTGIDSRKDNIIELGAVKFSLTENLASFDSLFHSPTRIPRFVERLTGIQNADLEDAPKFADKKSEAETFVSEAVLIGHNLPFDLDFLTAAGLDLTHQTALDTFLIAGLVLPRGESLALENLAQRFGVVHEEAHRALADAEATRDLLRVFIGLAKHFPREKWERIATLNATEKSWPHMFAELVLNSEIPPREYEATASEAPDVREDVVAQLSTEFSGNPKLLEVSAQPQEICAAAERLEKPSAIFFATNFSARRLPAAKSFAPQHYVDAAKLETFLSKQLTPTELPLAAKLILHEHKNRHELNLTRAENLLFDFVAAESLPEQSQAKVIVGDHAALEFDTSERLKIIADAATLPENLIRAKSLALDLPTLELLVPAAADKIQIWWGLLGLLFREAAPQFGKLNVADAAGLPSFSKVVDSGQHLLSEISSDVPPSVATALQYFLEPNSPFTKSLRSNALNEITLVLEPDEKPALDVAKHFLLDAALDMGDDFSFTKKLFGLPTDFPATKISTTHDQPRFFVAEDFPDPATPQFFSAVTKFLLERLPQLSGRTAIVFPNRVEAGNFAERATSELELPTFFRKLPNTEKLRELEKAILIFSLGNFRPQVEVQNFVLVKLPFLVRDGADFFTETLPATVLRFKKIWADFASFDSAEKFFALDSRLVTKKYGENFVSAISQTYESVIRLRPDNS